MRLRANELENGKVMKFFWWMHTGYCRRAEDLPSRQFRGGYIHRVRCAEHYLQGRAVPEHLSRECVVLFSVLAYAFSFPCLYFVEVVATCSGAYAPIFPCLDFEMKSIAPRRPICKFTQCIKEHESTHISFVFSPIWCRLITCIFWKYAEKNPKQYMHAMVFADMNKYIDVKGKCNRMYKCMSAQSNKASLAALYHTAVSPDAKSQLGLPLFGYDIHVYLHPCTHTYIHTYIHTYLE